MAEDKRAGTRIALVAGTTGLTGSELLRRLLAGNDYARIYAVTRRPLLLDHARLANRVLPLEQVGAQLKGLRCDDVFCSLGASQARRGSLGELQAVDRDLVAGFARAAQSFGATRCIVVSAFGADPAAANPFLRVKGQMEVALRELRFATLEILRPGRVLGARPQMSLLTALQDLLLPLANPLLLGPLEGRQGIAAGTLAAAMIGAAHAQRAGVHISAGAALRQLSRGAPRR